MTDLETGQRSAWRAIAPPAVILLLIVPVAFGQQKRAPEKATSEKTAPRLSEASITIAGARLRLGMTPRDVVNALPGMKMDVKSETDWQLHEAGGSEARLEFAKGTLNYAEYARVVADGGTAAALFAAVSALNQDGFKLCRVAANNQDTVTVECGEKSLAIERREINGKQVDVIVEKLGPVGAE